MFRFVRLSATAFLALALALPPALQAKTYQIDPPPPETEKPETEKPGGK